MAICWTVKYQIFRCYVYIVIQFKGIGSLNFGKKVQKYFSQDTVFCGFILENFDEWFLTNQVIFNIVG